MIFIFAILAEIYIEGMMIQIPCNHALQFSYVIQYLSLFLVVSAGCDINLNFMMISNDYIWLRLHRFCMLIFERKDFFYRNFIKLTSILFLNSGMFEEFICSSKNIFILYQHKLWNIKKLLIIKLKNDHKENNHSLMDTRISAYTTL